MQGCSDEAWNNFVSLSEPSEYEPGTSKRAAAVAAQFMGLANNGGLNSFLTSTYDLDAQEVVNALQAVGAHKAAEQLGRVVQTLGTPLLPSSQDQRWDLLERYWTEPLDDWDVLSTEADDELMAVLTQHVVENEPFYLGLG